jgi:hypothetical protein
MRSVFAVSITLLIAGCGPSIGSDQWCEELKAKPKGEWTGDEATEYTKYCVLGMDPKKWCEKMEATPKDQWTGEDAAQYAKQCLG